MGNMKSVGRNDLCPCGSGKKYKKCCINKLSIEKIHDIYEKQLNLSLNITNRDCCVEILRLGKTLIDNDKNYEWATGTYVNMANAKRYLYFFDDCMQELEEAKELCEKALTLKKNNQSALQLLFWINTELEFFDDAIEALERYDVSDPSHPMTIEIFYQYQRTLYLANQKKDNKAYKTFLGTTIDILFKKYGMYPGLCALACEYYSTIGNDVVKAYELGKRCVEKFPNLSTYNFLGMICLGSQLNRIDEAKEFFKKALELAEDEEMINNIKGNYFITLLAKRDFNEAEKVILELIEKKPSNNSFSNYADLLREKGEYDRAIKWAKKALFIVEDDTTLLILADLYKRKGMYREAIEIYKKCIQVIEDNGKGYTFTDFDGKPLQSITLGEELDNLLKEVFKGIISCYNQQKDYKNAKAFLMLAEEKLPESTEWNIWNEALLNIQNIHEEYLNAKKLLQDALSQNGVQRQYIREWALKLIQLQDSSKELDLDIEDDWEKYEKKMEYILDDMIKIVDKESEAYKNSKAKVNAKYSFLNSKAKEFLISAEVLYEIHKNSIIDFAPIVIEYCKVVEKQLRVVLANELTKKDKMLGNIIGRIDNNHIMPYFNYLDDLREVNKLRKESAHTGILGKEDVDKIRYIFFENNLLERLV